MTFDKLKKYTHESKYFVECINFCFGEAEILLNNIILDVKISQLSRKKKM